MPDSASLLAECRLFTRYLIDDDPDDYVCDRYRAIIRLRQEELQPQSVFDQLLLTLAGKHRLMTRAIDVYTRFFASGTAVRRRLVALLAIIESRAATARRLERPDCSGPAGFTVGMVLHSVLLAVLLVTAIVFLLPLQWLASGTRRNTTAT